MTTMAWPTIDLYLDTASAPLSAADFTANITNLSQRANITNMSATGITHFATKQGRSNAQSYFDAATLEFTVDNQNGQFDPTYTSAIPNLGVGNHVTLVATPSGGSASAVFSGYVDSFTPSYGFGSEEMTITATDMFKLLNLLTWQPSSPVAAQTADVRCQQILTDCGFSSSWVVVPSPAPTSICAAIPVNPDTGLMDHSEGALSAMQAAVHDTEDGLLYVRGDGRLCVASRMLRAGPAITPTFTFGDLFSSGTEIPYEPGIAILNDDALLVNGYTVTDSFGVSATYTDATSIAKYGPHYGSVTSLSATPNENMDEAQFRVQTNDTMGTRIDGITINPVQSAALGDYAALLPQSNLLPLQNQEGFETDATTGLVVISSATKTRDTTVYEEGAASLKVVSPGSVSSEGFGIGSAAGSTTNDPPVTVGTTYTFALWMLGSAGGESIDLSIFWRDSSGTALSTSSQTVALTTSWANYSMSATAPASSAFVELGVRTHGTHAYTWWNDAVTFSAVGVISPGWQFESASVAVKRRPPSGNTISQNCFVEGVNQSFDGNSWSTQLNLSNSSPLAAFSSSWLLLNDSTVGKLNTGTLGR